MTARTPVAVGSSTKLLTWTAVMQLVERGELDLDSDVNRWLDFEIPPAFGAPVTMRHLMTHSAGFEDRPLVGLMPRDPADVPELGAFLRANLPERVWPPGRYAAYSNYATGLAGYIVERVAGVPWERYVEREILAPLGMTGSTVVQPTPPEVLASAARGYRPAADGFAERPPVFSSIAPAGGWIATPDDAARFMRAHLGGGSLGDEASRILRPDTVERMKRTLHRHDPRVPGNAHGWWENELYGNRVLEQGGTQPGFETQLMLLPERAVGFFVATNSDAGKALWRALMHDFRSAFYPLGDEVAVRVAAAGSLERYAGRYQGTRYGTTTLAKLEAPLNQLEIGVGDDGAALTLFGDRFYPEGGGAFIDPASGARLVFAEGEGARPAALFAGPNPRQAYLASPGALRPEPSLALIAAALLTLLSVVLAWPFAGARARENRAARGALAATLVAFALFAVPFGWLLADPYRIIAPAGPTLFAALGAGLAAAGTALVGAVLTSLAWLRGRGSPLGRLHLTLGALGGAALVAVLHHWNLLGFRL